MEGGLGNARRKQEAVALWKTTGGGENKMESAVSDVGKGLKASTKSCALSLAIAGSNLGRKEGEQRGR